MNAKEYLESKGYEFPDKDFWMEDYVTDHKFKDLVQLMEDYAQQKLNIASVSGSASGAVDTVAEGLAMNRCTGCGYGTTNDSCVCDSCSNSAEAPSGGQP